jgi:polyhydroxybutyrate depolymerase
MRARIPTALLVAAAVVLFTTAETTHAGTGGARACAPQKAGNTWVTVMSAGVARSALVHVPPAAAKGVKPLPLVLAFHGAERDARWMERYTGLSRVGDKAGFFVAYPNGWGKPAVWNFGGGPGRFPDDVAFGRDLLDQLEQRFCIDPSRTFATGVSNGGSMAARLGCELSDRLRAIAVVAGGYAGLPSCRPARPLSVLVIHDTDDRVVPYEGRGPQRSGSVPRYVRGWAQRDHCPVRTGTSRPNRHVLRRSWGPCANGVTVEQLTVLGGGHEWPGAPAGRGLPRSISASGQIWRFFSTVRR